MTLIIPPGFGSAAFVFNSSSGTPEFVTTIGVEFVGVGGDFVGAADFIMSAYGATIMPATDSDIVLERVTLAVGQDGPGGSVDSVGSPITGGRSATGAPFALSCIVRKTTNELGRRGRGRMFLPGLFNQSDVGQDGSIITTRRDAIQTAVDLFDEALREPIGGVSTPPVLLHTQAPADPTNITALTVADLAGWVRGRIR